MTNGAFGTQDNVYPLEMQTIFAPNLSNAKLSKARVKHYVRKTHFYTYAAIKRVLDFGIALGGITVSSPVLVVISIAIKLDDPTGPVLFKQPRTGHNGKVFNIYKFRSMVAQNDVHDHSTADQHTRIGTLLRRTSLDELPQLFNILRGQMSIIGPRPWITDYYDNMTDTQRIRVKVRPGITGLAQAKGRNNVSIFDKINYDLEYVRDYSLYEDLKVIALTIRTVISGAGADAGKGTIQKELEDLKAQH